MNKVFFIQSGFKKRSAQYSQCLALENRLVFDGAAVATATEAQQADSSNNTADGAVDAVAITEPNVPVVDLPVTPLANTTTLPDTTANPSASKSIVFIDSAVRNVNDIVSAIDPNSTIVYLAAHQDGLTQIADYLADKSDIDNIQIISHAKEATLFLGNDIINNDTLVSHTEQLATIGRSLKINGDILLYGCDLAKNTDGQHFVDSFSYLTHADVAASTDTTGAANEGGNWTLEYSTGTIEASLLAATHYQDILAFPTYDVSGLSLVFGNNPTPPQVFGINGLTQGDVILFSNVVTVGGQVIDALVTIVDANPTDITINGLDSAAGTIGGTSLSSYTNWFALDTTSTTVGSTTTLRFEFIKGGSYNPTLGLLGEDVSLQNVTVNSYDIDNAQFQDFSGFSSYTLAGSGLPDTNLQMNMMPGAFARFSEINYVGDNTGDPATTLALFNQARVSTFYNEINTFEIRAGSTNNLLAHFYLDFSPGFNWNTTPPPITYNPPVNTVPAPQVLNDGTPLLIPSLSATDINGDLRTTQLTVGGGTLIVNLAGGATITSGANGSSTLTLSGTEAQIKAALATVTYTNSPATNTDTLTILSTDSVGLFDQDTVALTINKAPVNTVPAPQTITDGVSKNIPLSTTDINGNLATTTLSVTGGTLLVDLTGGATISAGTNGSSTFTLSGTEAQIQAALATVAYTNNTGTNSDTLTILSTDTFGLTDQDTVALTINNPPVNTVPTSALFNNGVSTPIAGLSTTDINNNLATTTLSVTSGILNINLAGGATITGGANGSNTLTLSGTEAQIKAALATVAYTNNVGVNNDTLTILSTDIFGLTDQDTVALAVNNPPVNTIPSSVTVSNGISTPLTGLSTTDINSNLATTTLTVTGGILNVNLAGGATITGGANGSNTLTLSGTEAQIKAALASVTYTNNLGINNDTLTILSTDALGLTDQDTVAINVTTNKPPVVVDDTTTGPSGTPITVRVLDNDSDPDGTLDPSTVRIIDPNGQQVTSLDVNGQGTWKVNPDGTITFTPFPGFSGSPTPISYIAKDNSGLAAIKPATITILVNLLPDASPDDKITNIGTPVTGNLFDKAISLGDIPTTLKFADQNGTPIPIGLPFITAAGGTITIQADGKYIYNPPPNMPVGRLTEYFNYTIVDFNGDTSSSILTITVLNPTVAPPVPVTPVAEPVIANFFTPQPLAATSFDFSLYTPSPDNGISLVGSLRDQVVLEKQPFSFDIPRWAFYHTNPNAQLVFAATRPDGTSLPEWLKFNPKLLRFYGTPPKDAQDESVMVIASDLLGHEANAIFNVHVNRESMRPEHKTLKLDLKLMGLAKAVEKSHAKEKHLAGNKGLTAQIHALDKLGKLQASQALLDSLKIKD